MLEYVHFYNGKSILNDEEYKSELEINSSLSKALGEIADTGFYYPFTAKYVLKEKENAQVTSKIIKGHCHGHSFEEVVCALYNSPESFNISQEEEKFYSKQELEYFRRVQKYLLFIGMKDLETLETPVTRYRNKMHSKYENALIFSFDDFTLNKVLNGERNFRVIDWYQRFKEPKTFKPKEYQALIVDKKDNFRMFIEFTHEEVKPYKDIKKLYRNTNLKDDDKLIVVYFKILEIFSY